MGNRVQIKPSHVENHDRLESLLVTEAAGSLAERLALRVDAVGGGVGKPRSKYTLRLGIQFNLGERPRLPKFPHMLVEIGFLHDAPPFTPFWRWFGGGVYDALLPTEIPEGPSSSLRHDQNARECRAVPHLL